MLADPAAIQNPFYRLIPDLMLVPMVVLATAATAIASQAVITGSYYLLAKQFSWDSCRGSKCSTNRRSTTDKSSCRG